ncbi:hypothetical protein [Bythopirellula goksoeyrii]|uniref:DUF2933 domain-containing protein n=1 Tax=Bythopirellula goksoeyrii TaxID=1400387 RepID=A0A5B9QNW0_9BACT|nr:hypothetical protein [Bythopirellula goksoeyrii]QEG35801.1 hypothetical protein Pr1d_31070 [Bythopirellula goksoeyrii]
MNHTMRMLLGCIIPLLLLFLLPLFGLGEGVSLYVAIVLMFACHLFMVGGDHRRNVHKNNHKSNQGDHHANH